MPEQERVPGKTLASSEPCEIGDEVPVILSDPAPDSAIDWGAALKHTAGDVELMQTVVGVFLKDFPRLLEEARQAIATSDSARLRRAGHTLKGSCGIFNAQAAFRAAAKLEQLGHAGNFSAAEPALGELTLQLELVRPHLEAFGTVEVRQDDTGHFWLSGPAAHIAEGTLSPELLRP